MRRVNVHRLIAAGCCAAMAAGCSGGSSTSAPTPTAPPPAAPLTAPVLESPADDEQLSTLRPSFSVRNSTGGSGARTYEFQVSDRSDFSPSSSGDASGYFPVTFARSGVAEGTSTTSVTPDQDLQPATRLFWRVRASQGSSTSDWSATRSVRTKIEGFNRPGELYDPLVQGDTVGTRVGATTFGPAGIRINDQNSYVRYPLAQTIPSGEFSMEVEGLRPNTPIGKLRIFSMMDGTGNLFVSKYLLNAQYRGTEGNPNNCISFKAVFGDSDIKLEPDIGVRTASVMMLDPGRRYYWRGTWGAGFRLVIQDGGIGGTTIYDYGQTVSASYAPTPHYAYLGANNGPYGEEPGSFPGATYRNVWLGSRSRPSSLGSALVPR